MENLRYNRAFKKGMIAIVVCTLIVAILLIGILVGIIQYHTLVSDMLPTKATITDIDLQIHYKGPNEQEIYITYKVDGTVYERELETDTTISFSAGRGAHYSVGDTVDIFYDPQNPERIAAPRSVTVGYFWLIGSALFLVFCLWIMWCMVKNKKRFLLTQAEYDKEGEDIKKGKILKKEQKKLLKAERKKKNAKARKIGKIILIVVGALVGAFVLFLLFGQLLISLGYGK